MDSSVTECGYKPFNLLSIYIPNRAFDIILQLNILWNSNDHWWSLQLLNFDILNAMSCSWYNYILHLDSMVTPWFKLKTDLNPNLDVRIQVNLFSFQSHSHYSRQGQVNIQTTCMVGPTLRASWVWLLAAHVPRTYLGAPSRYAYLALLGLVFTESFANTTRSSLVVILKLFQHKKLGLEFKTSMNY